MCELVYTHGNIRGLHPLLSAHPSRGDRRGEEGDDTSTTNEPSNRIGGG